MNSEKRLLGTTAISVGVNFIMGIYKIGLAIFTNSVLIFIYSFYNFGTMILKATFIKNYKKESEKYYLKSVKHSFGSDGFSTSFTTGAD